MADAEYERLEAYHKAVMKEFVGLHAVPAFLQMDTPQDRNVKHKHLLGEWTDNGVHPTDVNTALVEARKHVDRYVDAHGKLDDDSRRKAVEEFKEIVSTRLFTLHSTILMGKSREQRKALVSKLLEHYKLFEPVSSTTLVKVYSDSLHKANEHFSKWNGPHRRK